MEKLPFQNQFLWCIRKDFVTVQREPNFWENLAHARLGRISFVFPSGCSVSVTWMKLPGGLGRLSRTCFQHIHEQLCCPVALKVLGKWGGVKDPPLHPHVTLGKWVVLSALPTKGFNTLFSCS